MMRGTDDTSAAEEALERLFRLTGGRKMYARQSAVVGVLVTRAGYVPLRGWRWKPGYGPDAPSDSDRPASSAASA